MSRKVLEHPEDQTYTQTLIIWPYDTIKLTGQGKIQSYYSAAQGRNIFCFFSRFRPYFVFGVSYVPNFFTVVKSYTWATFQIPTTLALVAQTIFQSLAKKIFRSKSRFFREISNPKNTLKNTIFGFFSRFRPYFVFGVSYVPNVFTVVKNYT